MFWRRPPPTHPSLYEIDPDVTTDSDQDISRTWGQSRSAKKTGATSWRIGYGTSTRTVGRSLMRSRARGLGVTWRRDSVDRKMRSSRARRHPLGMWRESRSGHSLGTCVCLRRCGPASRIVVSFNNSPLCHTTLRSVPMCTWAYALSWMGPALSSGGVKGMVMMLEVYKLAGWWVLQRRRWQRQYIGLQYVVQNCLYECFHRLTMRQLDGPRLLFP